MDHSSRFLDLVNLTKENIPEITVDELKTELKEAHPEFYLIDVREESEWSHGAIATAIYLGKGVIERDIEKIAPNLDAKIVLYCGGGFRSLLAGDSLKKMGYKNVYSLAGGYRAWREHEMHV